MIPQCCPDFACLAGFLGFGFDVISSVKPLQTPFPVMWFQFFPSRRVDVPTVDLSYDAPNKYCYNWGPAKQKVFDWISMSFVLLSKSVPKALSVNGRKQKRKIGVWCTTGSLMLDAFASMMGCEWLCARHCLSPLMESPHNSGCLWL